MALSHGLATAGTPPESLTTTATSNFEKTEAGFRLTTMEVRVRARVPGLDADGFAKAAQAAIEGCPVSNALKGNVKVELDAALE
jgi:osmotically inducible protein OsmC